VHPTRQQLDELDALLQRMLDLPVNQVDDEPDEPEAAAEPPISYRVPIAESAPSLEPRVVPAEESLRPPPPRPAEQAPPPVFEAPPAVQAPTAREPGPDDWVRLASTWQPSAQTWQPLAQSWQQASRPGERPVAPMPPPAPPAPVQSFPVSRPVESPEVMSAPVPVKPVQPTVSSSDDLADLVIPPMPVAETKAPDPKQVERGPGYAWWQWPFVPANVVFDVATLALGPLGAGMRSRAGRNFLAAIGIGCMAAAAVVVAADEFGWIW
jgi:hypothetical protein